METQSAASARPSLVRVAPLIVLVALCAGFVSGSCTAQMEGSNGAAVLSAALSAGVALGIGLLFLIITRDRREVWFFAMIGVSAYIAAEFGAWYPFIWPGVVALLIAIVGAVNAGSIAVKAFSVPRSTGQGVAALSIVSILAATIAVVWGFYTGLTGSFGVPGFESSSIGLRTYRFALIVGVIPPVVSAVSAWLIGYICRWAGNRL